MAIVTFIGLVLGGVTGFWIAVSLVIALAVFADVGEKAQDEAYREWSSTFRCGRCGTVFAVVEEKPSNERLLGEDVVRLTDER